MRVTTTNTTEDKKMFAKIMTALATAMMGKPHQTPSNRAERRAR